MPRKLSAALAIAGALLFSATLSAPAAPAHKPAAAHHGPKKRHISRHWHGYGFLPGYRPPEVIARERAERYWANGPHYYGPAWPGFYHGRWNGGGFGPCWVSTPIGYMPTCGQ